MVEVWQPFCLMPDHIHMIIRVNESLPPKKHLGHIIAGFKGGISRAWWRQESPLSAPVPSTAAPVPSPSSAAPVPLSSVPVFMASAMDAFSSRWESHAPLFEDDYNDRILFRYDQLKIWKDYLRDNPFRLFVRRKNPDIMQRALCLVIDGIRYGAFGNFMLLRYPEKHQVFFHRKTWDENQQAMLPTQETNHWTTERQRLLFLAAQGDVLVTPGISECEKRIKNEALSSNLRLIHLQKEPIGKMWKPEKSRFNACASGSLLILAPWEEDLRGDSDYERFHHLNDLAASICEHSALARCHVVQ